MTTNDKLIAFRNAVTFHESPIDGKSSLGAFAHSICGHDHLRTMDCECQGCYAVFDTLLPVAGALEASEARVARLRAHIIENDLRYLARLPPTTDHPVIGEGWPADLLEAMATADSELICGCEDNTACRHAKARATLVRYGLVEREAR